ncbi:MAG: ABC transporter substrate-binding protein [Angelakisella sp.]
MKRTLSFILSMVMALSLLAGCGGQSAAPASGTPSAAPAAPAGDAQKPAGNTPVELTFFYPVGVGGPLATLIENLAAEFTKENPDIKLNPVFAGNSVETMTKTVSAVQGGTPPDFAILGNSELYSLVNMDAIMPLDDLIKADGGDEYIKDFLPAFMKNSYYDGKVWSIPYQRSTIIMYYNKDHFKEVGLDPENPPKNWEELRAAAAKLTKRDASGNVTRWGVMIPMDDPFMFSAFALQNSENGENLMTEDGKKAIFDTAGNAESLQFLIDLAKKDKVMPEGSIKWADGPANFMEGTASITYTSTGSLTNILNNSKFEVGTCFLPAGKRYGSPTGGANIYIFKDTPPENQAAAWKFIRWITEPQRTAQWNIDTGYVATRSSAFETPLLKDYYNTVPQAKTGGDQLPHAGSELMLYDNQRNWQALKVAIDAALTGAKTPQQAMADAQAEADAILAKYQ